MLERLRAFEPAALAEVYDTFSPAIYRYAVRLLGDAIMAEDCVTDTFTRLVDALKTGGPIRLLKAYLYRVAHNWITDYFRSANRLNVSLGELTDAKADGVLSTVEAPPLQVVSSRIEAQHVRAALMRLTADQRQVIMLKYYEGLSNEEVAAAISKPVGAIKSLQHRALVALRRELVRVVADDAG
ncbi:MAG: sigma-70 family RNA polymerase sigma factor [Anaerolineae bacterium]|nr:sigma-70 family RNA polymerase sigma factor [Candidatus Roseilinea sp.]MDW8449447.1 sigma-70 family RNA polymerase sigma factor [Anaerolineae bacterium]